MEVAVQVVLMPMVFRHLQHRHLWRLAVLAKLQSEVRDRVFRARAGRHGNWNYCWPEAASISSR